MIFDASSAASDDLTDRMVRGLYDAIRLAGSSTVSILIDPTLADPLADDAFVQDALVRGDVLRVELPRIHDDVDPDATPYLLHANDAPRAERALNASLALAAAEALDGVDQRDRGRSVCAWVIGDTKPRDSAKRLADAARIVRPDGRPWPLRYWDPRVLWHLPRVMPQLLWRDLQSKLGQWWTLDALNQFVSYAAVGTPTASEDCRPVRIEAPVWDRLSRIGAINTVLRMAWGWGLLPTTQNADRIERLIARCESLGFASEQDALVFAACGLTSHDRFDEHPRIAAALRQSSSDGNSVRLAIAPFTEDFWSEIASSRWLDETSRAPKS
jgi:hypothetical protein